MKISDGACWATVQGSTKRNVFEFWGLRDQCQVMLSACSLVRTSRQIHHHGRRGQKAPGIAQDSSPSLRGSVSGNQSGDRAVSYEDNVPGTSHAPSLKLPPALYIFRVWTKFPAYDRRDTAHIQAQKDLRKMESNKRERRRNS